MPGAGRVPDSWFLVDAAEVAEDRLRLAPDESRHLLRVFRATPGTRFEATDGQGTLYRCVLESGEEDAAVARVESSEREVGELPFRMELLVGLPDLPQTETIVEQATALGAGRIAFVATDRVGPERLSPARLSRLHRVAASAIKQARRTRFPSIAYVETLEGALKALDPASWRVLAHPAGQARLPDQSLGPQPIIQIAVGPPGGFLDDEVVRMEVAGFLGISLGPNRLTTSTASLSILAWTRNSLLSMGLA